MLWFPVFVAFGIALGLTRRFLSPASRLHILDHPNDRSLHDTPVPRTGGVAIAAALAVGAALVAATVPLPSALGWVGAGAVLLAAVGFLDDRTGIGSGRRLLVHLAAAGLVVAAGLGLGRIALPGASLALAVPLGGVITVLFLIWFVNLYNFMDGMDGFAGGMAVFGFGGLAVFGVLGHEPAFAALNAVVAAAAAGFLVYNFPPARIFLGDAGSPLLGYFAGVSSLWGVRLGLFAIWVPVLIFSPFIVDATVTLVRRALRGERVWEAHCSHYYQRLVRLGWGHRRTVLAEYALMAAVVASALWTRWLAVEWQWMLIGLWVLAYAVVLAGIEALERRRGIRT